MNKYFLTRMSEFYIIITKIISLANITVFFPIIFIIPTIIWPQVNNQEGTQPYPSTENWIEDLLSLPPPISTRPSFPLSQSFPSGSFHKPLILLHQRTDRLKSTITEN